MKEFVKKFLVWIFKLWLLTWPMTEVTEIIDNMGIKINNATMEVPNFITRKFLEIIVEKAINLVFSMVKAYVVKPLRNQNKRWKTIWEGINYLYEVDKPQARIIMRMFHTPFLTAALSLRNNSVKGLMKRHVILPVGSAQITSGSDPHMVFQLPLGLLKK